MPDVVIRKDSNGDLRAWVGKRIVAVAWIRPHDVSSSYACYDVYQGGAPFAVIARTNPRRESAEARKAIRRRAEAFLEARP